MIGDHERHPGVAVHRAAQAGDAGSGVEQGLRRKAAHGDDELRLDERDLTQQVRRASCHLVGLGIAVSGGAALEDVADEDVLAALQADRRQHVVEQLAGLSYEGLAEPVFLRPGRFAHEHPSGALAADAENRLRAVRAQLAVGATCNPRLETGPVELQDIRTARRRRHWFGGCRRRLRREVPAQAPHRREPHLRQDLAPAPVHSASLNTSASSRPPSPG